MQYMPLTRVSALLISFKSAWATSCYFLRQFARFCPGNSPRCLTCNDRIWLCKCQDFFASRVADGHIWDGRMRAQSKLPQAHVPCWPPVIKRAGTGTSQSKTLRLDSRAWHHGKSPLELVLEVVDVVLGIHVHRILHQFQQQWNVGGDSVNDNFMQSTFHSGQCA